MKDLHEYSFGEWFSIFLRAVPAFLLAQLVVLACIAVVAAVPALLVRLLMVAH
jgi:hypothetical protein